MATFIPETDYARASAGEWLPAPPKPVPAEGVVKMRGLPFTATKQDIVLFFQGFGLTEDKVGLDWICQCFDKTISTGHVPLYLLCKRTNSQAVRRSSVHGVRLHKSRH